MAQPVDIISVPWDSGRRGWRMGAGPGAMLDMGLVQVLEQWGHDVRVLEVDQREGGPIELLPATLQLAATTSHYVRRARLDRRFPLVLTGNCMMTVGAIAGMDGGDVAIAWLDAHGDLNTPATSRSGFLDGMAAATLLGWCHLAASADIDGFRPVCANRFALLGARDLDPGEVAATRRHAVRVLSPEDVASEPTLECALDDLIVLADGVWLHIDLDVLDPAPLAPANSLTPPGGLSLFQLVRIVQGCAARGCIAGMTLSAYDPACDRDGLVRAAVVPLVSEALQTSDRSGDSDRAAPARLS